MRRERGRCGRRGQMKEQQKRRDKLNIEWMEGRQKKVRGAKESRGDVANMEEKMDEFEK